MSLLRRCLNAVCFFSSFISVFSADILPTLVLDDEEESRVEAVKTVSPANAASVPETGEDAEPGSSEIHEKSVSETELAEAAVCGAVEYLKKLSSADVEGFVIPPVRHRVVVGYENKMLRYSEQMVNVPVYETVEEYRNVSIGESTDAAKVRRKVKVKKIAGYKKEKKLVRDNNGPVEQMTKVPKFGPGGPDEWRPMLIGWNAMAVYALVCAGTPYADEAVCKPLDALKNLFAQYGYPDGTWDLAWTAAAFSAVDNEECRRMAGEMVGKLVDGQIMEGPCKGLWGPDCINTELLAAMMRKQTEYSDFYMKVKERFDEKKRDSDARKMDEAVAALQQFEKLMKRVSMICPEAWDDSLFVAKRDKDGVAPPLNIANSFSYCANQCSADIGSTAAAVYALQIALREKTAPAETWRPKDEKGRPMTPPRRTSDAVKAVISALVASQNSTGGWTEMNMHQPVSDFDKIPGIDGVPIGVRTFPALDSPQTGTSSAEAYSCFTCYAQAAGVSGLNSIAKRVIAANSLLQKTASKGLNEVDGGFVPPYDFCFYISNAVDLGKPEYDVVSREDLVRFLAENQNADGSWGGDKPARKLIMPSSVRERTKVLPAYIGDKGKTDGFDRGKPFVRVGKEAESRQKYMTRYYSYQLKPLRTIFALLALTSESEWQKE